MKWFHEPSTWSVSASQLTVHAEAHTDFWRVTGYD